MEIRARPKGLIFTFENREKKGKQHGNNCFSLHLSRRNTCNLPVEQSRAAGENKSSYGIQAGGADQKSRRTQPCG